MSKFVHSARKLAVFVALLLSLTVITPTFATDSSIVNGSFDDNGNPDKTKCSLNGWSHKGDVKVVDGIAEGLAQALNTPDNCVAMIDSHNNQTSQLEQTFEVSSVNPHVWFYIWAKTSPESFLKGYSSQVINLYDANNNLIYSGGKNENKWQDGLFLFHYDLTKQIGQKVRLEIKVEVQKKNPASPEWSTLYIDRVAFIAPEHGTIQGTYAW